MLVGGDSLAQLANSRALEKVIYLLVYLCTSFNRSDIKHLHACFAGPPLTWTAVILKWQQG